MFSLHFSGTSAILLRFTQEISLEINAQVLSVKNKILESSQCEIFGIKEIIIAYASLLVCFDARVINSTEKIESLVRFLESFNLLGGVRGLGRKKLRAKFLR